MLGKAQLVAKISEIIRSQELTQVEDRQARMAIAREWKEQEERARIRRVQRSAS